MIKIVDITGVAAAVALLAVVSTILIGASAMIWRPMMAIDALGRFPKPANAAG